MELKILKTFIAVAELGTVARASERLHCVQSNVTTRIKSLEAETGVALFERRRSGMRLTAAGEHFLPHARQVLASAEAAEAALAGFSDNARLLRVGSMETTLAVRLPDVFRRFRAAHPHVTIRVTAGPTDDLAARLLDGRLDIALVGGAFRHPDITGQPVFAEEMVLATPKAFASVEEARTLPVAVFRQGCSYREFTLRWMRGAGLAPNEVFELGTLDGILGCVTAGLGVSCLPRAVVENSLFRDHLRLHPVGKGAVIETYAITRGGAGENGAVRLFLDELTAGRQAA